jgi:hypothetical protein
LRSESLEPRQTLLDEFWPDALSRLKQSVKRANLDARPGGTFAIDFDDTAAQLP